MRVVAADLPLVRIRRLSRSGRAGALMVAAALAVSCAENSWELAGVSKAAGGSELWPDEGLAPGERLTSGDGRFALIYQDDGNLVLYDETGAPLWHTDTWDTSPGVAVMQSDGNLVVYDEAGTPLWSSETWGHEVQGLFLQDDGNLVIYDLAGTALWSSGTGGREAGPSPDEGEAPVPPGPEPGSPVVPDARPGTTAWDPSLSPAEVSITPECFERIFGGARRVYYQHASAGEQWARSYHGNARITDFIPSFPCAAADCERDTRDVLFMEDGWSPTSYLEGPTPGIPDDLTGFSAAMFSICPCTLDPSRGSVDWFVSYFNSWVDQIEAYNATHGTSVVPIAMTPLPGRAPRSQVQIDFAAELSARLVDEAVRRGLPIFDVFRGQTTDPTTYERCLSPSGTPELCSAYGSDLSDGCHPDGWPTPFVNEIPAHRMFLYALAQAFC